jgi:hypothetical protein
VSGIKRKVADVAADDDDVVVETAGPSGGSGKKARKGLDPVVWVLKDVLAEVEELWGDLKEISHTQIQYVSAVVDAFQKMTQEIRGSLRGDRRHPTVFRDARGQGDGVDRGELG